MSEIYYKPNYPIYFSIPLPISGIDLMVYMRMNGVNTMRSYYQVGYPTIILYLQKHVTVQQRNQMSNEYKIALSYPITLGNLYMVKEKFKEVLNWFNEDNLKLLYGVNDRGMLIFNSEYSSLNMLCVTETGSKRTALKIVPTVVETANEQYQPGVVVYINKKDNAILLKESEIKRLCEFIISFDFISMSNFIINCMHYSEETGQFLSYDEVLKRMEMNHSYDKKY